ncbi:hypothetical protein IMSAGC007_04166 [Lachnospiraceae bacterium]|nr:hypothetical protein IMSAGC007_04166 [Lachnospiraceae bacterium]
MSVIGIEVINFLNQLRFNGVILTELFFIICYFLVYGGRINFHVDFFLHHCRKMGIADQFYYHFGYGIVQKFFPYLLSIIAFMPPLHTTVFTPIIKEIFVFCTVFFIFDAFIPIHPCTAYGTFYNPRKQMRPFIFPFINVFIFLRLCNQFCLCRIPDILWNNSLMQSVYQKKIFLLHKMVFISCSVNFFCFPASISNFTAIDWIFQYQTD